MYTFVAATFALALALAQNPGTLEAARDLYAAAAFEEALASLDRIDRSSLRSPEEERLLVEYRMFTLYALRREADAREAAETLIRRDPSAALLSADASPRIRTMYDTVRARLLPQLIRDHYRAGRAALEKKDFATAERELSSSARLLAAAKVTKIDDSGLDDLSVLVDGFLVLSKSPPATVVPVDDVRRTPAASNAPASKPIAPVAPVAPTASVAAKSTFSVDDKDVVPPVALQQKLPEVPASLHRSLVQGNRMLVVNVTIDDTGRVRRADVATPFNPVYDRMVVDAASKWRYRPATKGGVPVSYVQALAVTVR